MEAQECMIDGRWMELASLMLTSADLIFSKASEKGEFKYWPFAYCLNLSLIAR